MGGRHARHAYGTGARNNVADGPFDAEGMGGDGKGRKMSVRFLNQRQICLGVDGSTAYEL